MIKKLTVMVVLLAVSLLCAASAFAAAPPKKVLIGISKIVSHPALDAVVKGVEDELKAAKIDATFDVQNANGDANTAASIANKFQTEQVNVAVGVATPTAQALVNTLKRTPIVFSAVTDPVKAGLVGSLKKGDKWVTGVSDMTPVKQQIETLLRIKKVKKLGHIYASSEANAVELAGIVKQVCKQLGLEYVETTVTKSSEVKQAAQAIAHRVDAIYISTDNTVVSAMSAVTEVAMKSKIPVVSADPSSAESQDVLAAFGFDYYKMGRETGKMVIEILKGKKTEQMPTRFMTKPTDMEMLVNLDVAKKLGLTVPKDLEQNAKIVRQNGKLIKK